MLSGQIVLICIFYGHTKVVVFTINMWTFGDCVYTECIRVLMHFPRHIELKAWFAVKKYRFRFLNRSYVTNLSYTLWWVWAVCELRHTLSHVTHCHKLSQSVASHVPIQNTKENARAEKSYFSFLYFGQCWRHFCAHSIYKKSILLRPAGSNCSCNVCYSASVACNECFVHTQYKNVFYCNQQAQIVFLMDVIQL